MPAQGDKYMKPVLVVMKPFDGYVKGWIIDDPESMQPP
jgi:hypothetical protein